MPQSKLGLRQFCLTMRGSFIVLSALVALAATASAEKKSYDGYQVIRVHLHSDKAADSLNNILDADEQHGIPKFRLLNEPARGGFADILTLEHKTLTSLLTLAGVNFEVANSDVGASIKREAEMIEKRRQDFAKEGGKQFDLLTYHPIEEIYGYLVDLNENQYPDITELVNIGQTYEGQDMWVLKICRDGCGTKPTMYIEAGIHAREWIGPATALYIMDRLLTAYGTDAAVTELGDTFDWYFLVEANPDGYRYTWTDDRYWRKTRSLNAGSVCIGTDPNRNFAVGWGGIGSSDSPCSDTYHGPSAFSEKNTQNIRDFILGQIEVGINFVYMQDFHSYSQEILYPYGYTAQPAPDADDLQTLGDIGNAALAAAGGETYIVGPTATTIYPASGIVVDWYYDGAGVKYSYTIELRDTGRYGFELPPDQIQPTGEEMWAFHEAIAYEIINRNFE